MSTIQLEPVPNRWPVLQSITGHVLYSGFDGQRILFSVCVPKDNHGVTRLTTGEKLEDLEGDVALCRGKMQTDGQPFTDTISYVSPMAADADRYIPRIDGGFSVRLHLDERIFDQLVSLSCASGLPWISLDFDSFQKMIFGDAPDGSEQIWNTKDYPTVHIAGAMVVIHLADHIDHDKDETLDPELAPPTLAQLNRRFGETFQLLTQLQRSLTLLNWTALAIVATLIITRLL